VEQQQNKPLSAAEAHDEVLRIGQKESKDLGKLSEDYLEALDKLYQANQRRLLLDQD
jgi:hypothetical protein